MAEAEQSHEEQEEGEGLTGPGRNRRQRSGSHDRSATHQPRAETGGIRFPEGRAQKAAYERERALEETRQAERAETERVAQGQAVEQRALAAERYRSSRAPDAFQFRIERRADTEGFDLGLYDVDGAPLTDVVVKDGDVTEAPVLLTDYVPELKDFPPSSDQLEGGGGNALLLPLITRALEQAGQAKMDAAKAKFDAAKAKLLKVHEKEERTEGYEKAEEMYRESVAHIFHEREHRLREILKKVFKDQNIDLASELGGTETLLNTREEGNKRWMEEHLIFPEHHEDKTLFSAVTNLPAEFIHGVRVEQALLDKKYEKLEHEIEALSEGAWNNIRKSGGMKGFREIRRDVRKAAQWIKPAIATPLSAGAAVGGGLLLLLGKILGPVFEKPWATMKEYANEFSFDQAFKDDGHGGGTPKKKSGGGGGHH